MTVDQSQIKNRNRKSFHQPGAITGGQGAGNAMGLGFNEVVKQDRCGERLRSGPYRTVPGGVPSGNATTAGPWQAKSQNLAEDGHQFKGCSPTVTAVTDLIGGIPAKTQILRRNFPP
jgi:hypothetical protein